MDSGVILKNDAESCVVAVLWIFKFQINILIKI